MKSKVLEKEEKEDGQQWTPYNANMSMQGIKVRLERIRKKMEMGIDNIVFIPPPNEQNRPFSDVKNNV